jgi:site-specific recombinase XerD
MNVTLFSHHIPASVARSVPRVKSRFLEFFTAQIRNPNTRRSYAKGTIEFLRWCETWGATSLPSIAPMHVAGWIEEMTHTHSAPTVKQRLATVRHLFDWLVTGQVMATNPAQSVRGPAHSRRTGKTPVLAPKRHGNSSTGFQHVPL